MENNTILKGIKIIDNQEGKTVCLDYKKPKQVIFWLFTIPLIAITIIFIFFPEFDKDTEGLTFQVRIIWIIFSWAGFLGLYFIFYYPLFLILTKKLDGSLFVDKRDWFFIRNKYVLRADQEPRMIARHRRMVGATIFIPTVYQPIIHYRENGSDYDINLVFIASYWMKGIGPRNVFKKEEIEEIAQRLNLPLTFEE